MIYLCLGYFLPEKVKVLPKKKVDDLIQQCQPLLKSLFKTGHVVAEDSIDLKYQNFPSFREEEGLVKEYWMGRAFLIEADTMENAIRLASLHPATEVRERKPLNYHLEIRPVHHFLTKE
ncbi:hypothetical protein ACFQPF_01500 [Fictibacillus iocasae]|uniref:YCII-related domain-containing protein n=1 Tax=Fictibacillus iocasae TaxID=2715437 RepID=A0ABW2NIN4_9BACL